MDEPSAPADQDFLLRYLAGRDEPCPSCGYNLRDLATNRCPECGLELAIKVNVVDPRFAAMITGLVGLSAGAGLNVLLLIYGLVRFPSGQNASIEQFFICNGVGAAVEVVALFVWLKWWRRLRRESPRIRWGMALTCWLLTFANLAYFTSNVR